jgi:hypothetical protein
MAKYLKLACPMVRRGASLNANQAGRQLPEKWQYLPTLQLSPDYHPTVGFNAVNLKDRLRNVETDCSDRLHIELLRIVGASTSSHFHGTHVPVEEPSTASKGDIGAFVA